MTPQTAAHGDAESEVLELAFPFAETSLQQDATFPESTLIKRRRCTTCVAAAARGSVHAKGSSSIFLMEKMSTLHTHLDCTRSAPYHGTTNLSTIPSISKQQNPVKNGHLKREKHVKNVRNLPQAQFTLALSTES
jgi:hypothetical protein